MFCYKFYNYCLSNEERIVVSLFLVMSTTQVDKLNPSQKKKVDKLNGWSSKKKKKITAVKFIMYKGFLVAPRWQK